MEKTKVNLKWVLIVGNKETYEGRELAELLFREGGLTNLKKTLVKDTDQETPEKLTLHLTLKHPNQDHYKKIGYYKTGTYDDNTMNTHGSVMLLNNTSNARYKITKMMGEEADIDFVMRDYEIELPTTLVNKLKNNYPELDVVDRFVCVNALP